VVHKGRCSLEVEISNASLLLTDSACSAESAESWGEVALDGPILKSTAFLLVE
jgi:hypothetical protein